MTTPASLVSVIIPTWNRASTLLAAVRSAVAQGGVSIEVLVCDDGSADGSRALIEELRHPLVRWVDGPHCGKPAVVRNRGIAASKGEWLAFLDSDDEWVPGKLSAQVAAMRAQGCLAACSNALRVVPGSGARGTLVNCAKPRIGFGELLRENSVVCSSAVFHHTLVKKVHGFPEHADVVAAEDYALWLRIASLTSFAYVSEPLVNYRDAPAESIRNRSPQDEALRMRHVRESFLAWAPAMSRHALWMRWDSARKRLREMKQQFRESARG